jgi:hypothetical protein
LNGWQVDVRFPQCYVQQHNERISREEGGQVPKLYEYFGLVVLFYANEHEPVHVHGKFQGRESRAEIILVNGVVTEIRYGEVAGRQPLEQTEMRFFAEVLNARADDIVAKWIDFFVLHKPVKAERITRRLK